MRRILFQETDFNTLPNPPAGFKYIGFDGDVFSEKSSDGTTTETGGGGGIVDIIYDNFVNLINTGFLVPGRWYRIQNFRTCYDQPNYDWDGNEILEGNFKQGDLHPLVVRAISATAISIDAYQPDFPNDRIKYDWTYGSTEISGQDAFGRIIERIDDKNNRTDFDHREVLYKRYKNYTYDLTSPLSGTVSIGSPSGSLIPVTGIDTNFTSLSEGDIIAIPYLQGKIFMIDSIDSDTIMTIKSDTAGYLSPTNDMMYYSTIDGGYTSYRQSPVQSFTNESQEFHLFPENYENVWNNYFGDVRNLHQWEESSFDLPNVVILNGSSYNNKFGHFCVNNTFGVGYVVRDNNVGDYFSGNSINTQFSSNEIGNHFRNNTIKGDNFLKNKVQNQFYDNYITCSVFESNTIGNYFYNNHISEGLFSTNNIENDFWGNQIYANFSNNRIGNAFRENNIYNAFDENRIELFFNNNTIGSQNNIDGYSFWSNTIGSYFEYNHIMVEFWFNNISLGFKSNETLQSFSWNQTGTTCISNTFKGLVDRNVWGSWFLFNIFEGDFKNNRIASSFDGNHIKDGFGIGGGSSRGNVIGNYFVNNDIGEYFYDNTIADQFQDNTIGDHFQYNEVKVNYLSGVNFKDYLGNIATFSFSEPTSTETDTWTVAQTSTTGNGTASTFTVVTNGSVVESVTLINGGYEHLNGDVITISADQFGGDGDDLFITIIDVSETPLVYVESNCTIQKSRTGTNVITTLDLDTNSFYISSNINGPYDSGLLGYV